MLSDKAWHDLAETEIIRASVAAEPILQREIVYSALSDQVVVKQRCRVSTSHGICYVSGFILGASRHGRLVRVPACFEASWKQ